MVFCDGGTAINVLASAFTNGVCCIADMQADDERIQRHKNELRRTLNVEYERQRLYETEIRERMMREENLFERIEDQRRKLAEERRHGLSHFYVHSEGPQQPLELFHTSVWSAGSFVGSDVEKNTLSLEPIHLDPGPQSFMSDSCPRRRLMITKRNLLHDKQDGREGDTFRNNKRDISCEFSDDMTWSTQTSTLATSYTLVDDLESSDDDTVA